MTTRRASPPWKDSAVRPIAFLVFASDSDTYFIPPNKRRIKATFSGAAGEGEDHEKILKEFPGVARGTRPAQHHFAIWTFGFMISPRYCTMLKSALFLLFAGLTAIALPRLSPGSQNPAPANAPNGRVSIQGAVTNTITSDGIAGVQINLSPVEARGVVAQDPQVLREAATRAGLSTEEVDRVVSQQAARAAQLANNSTEAFSVESDRSGKFLIEGVPSGIYTLTASLESYLYSPPLNPGLGSETYNTQITVTPGQKVADISIPMVRGSTISGRVLDAAGRPATNQQVNALRLVYQQGRPMLQTSASKTTDDHGDFRLFYLSPGEYILAAGQPGGARGLAGLRGAAAPQAEVPLRTYFPREIDPALASKIRIGTGEEHSGINLTLRASRVFTVRGQVTTTVPLAPVIGPNGQARGGNVTLALSPRAATLGEQAGAAAGFTLDANGAATFQLTNVLPGEYYLIGRLNQPIAVAAGAGAGGGVQAANNPVFARMPVDVRDNVDGIRFVIPPPVTLKGSVTLGSPSMTRPSNIRLYVINQTSYNGFPAYGRGQAAAAADGTFEIPGVPEGEYILDVTVPSGPRGGDAYVADVLFGGTSVIESGFHIDDKPPVPLQVVLKSGTGSVEGTVFNVAHKPATGVFVVLVPVKHRNMPSMYPRTTTDTNGHFLLRGIPPGDYDAYSWEEYLQTSEQDAAFIEKYKDKGQHVIVSAQSASTTEIHMIPRLQGS